ncbi:MAG TPA: biotin-dependent carboxyltransferase family protein [Gammaproteobacteria bacterium]|nr:biotin-dependent carboxyltransferase family protein [Gammaproteobacteria bacterium]
MIKVLQPGRLTTIQDLGRNGYAHMGVPASGAVDIFDLRVANRLVGNPDGEAALEITAEGPVLRFTEAAHVALTGGKLEALLDGEPVPMYQTLAVKAGGELACGRVMQGWRCYLAVAGGIAADPVLGSRSRDTLSMLGPEPLAAGITLPLGHAPQPAPSFYLRSPPQYAAMPPLRVMAGPQQDWFTPEALLNLRRDAYKVQPQSDRVGVRFDGAPLERGRGQELPSMGMVAGAMQVPPSGKPIALLMDHGTTGGYPVIAVVISADLPLLAQLAPGTAVRFSDVSRQQALAAAREQAARLVRDLVAADAGLLAARALMNLAGGYESLRQAAISDGKRRIRIRK